MEKRFAFLALALAGACWGLGFPLGKFILTETDAAHMVLLRFATAAIAAAPFALARAETRALFRSPVILAAGAFYGIAFMVQFEGLAHVSVTLAALLVGAMPALIAISARLLGEKVSRASWLGVAAATLGAALIAGKPDGAGSPLGVALSLGSLLIFLAWLLVLRRAPPSPTPMAIPAVTVIVATFTVLPIALLMHGPPKLDLSPLVWTAVVGQGVLATLLATAAWSFGAARVDAASAGVFINIEPLMGASLGVMLFGDHLTFALGAGGLLIIAGSFIVVLGEKRQPLVTTSAGPI
ncbi:DMT family transporter [Caulobacter sp. DWP3-1-3b2]|uniref:DMT family transporter n=1 Tax=Caulobacter sp. DWP3-1-3b2 TaxID=2804643 RepID=UPI003CFA5060